MSVQKAETGNAQAALPNRSPSSSLGAIAKVKSSISTDPGSIDAKAPVMPLLVAQLGQASQGQPPSLEQGLRSPNAVKATRPAPKVMNDKLVAAQRDDAPQVSGGVKDFFTIVGSVILSPVFLVTYILWVPVWMLGGDVEPGEGYVDWWRRHWKDILSGEPF